MDEPSTEIQKLQEEVVNPESIPRYNDHSPADVKKYCFHTRLQRLVRVDWDGLQNEILVVTGLEVGVLKKKTTLVRESQKSGIQYTDAFKKAIKSGGEVTFVGSGVLPRSKVINRLKELK